MAQAKDAQLRLKIVADRNHGVSYTELAKRYGINYHTVRTLCLRYKTQGQSGLLPKYSNCGRHIKAEHEKCFRLVRLIKHLHSDWGIPYIVVRIKESFPDLPMQSIRHYQRRLNLSTNKIPKQTLPPPPSQDRPRQAHDEWQIDAKERIILPNGKEACFLNITDTKTHALLKAKVFSLR